VQPGIVQPWVVEMAIHAIEPGRYPSPARFQEAYYYHRSQSGSCSLSVKREIRHQSASLHLAVSMGLIACVNIAKHYTR
jgi:hypothetical protein